MFKTHLSGAQRRPMSLTKRAALRRAQQAARDAAARNRGLRRPPSGYATVDTFLSAIQSWCAARPGSAADLSRWLGLHYSSVQRWLASRKIPAQKTIMAIDRWRRVQDLPEAERRGIMADRRYYLRHRDKIRAQAKAWAQANPERMTAMRRAWRDRNPELARECGRTHARKNRAANNRRVKARYARVKDQPVTEAVRARRRKAGREYYYRLAAAKKLLALQSAASALQP